MSRCNSKSPRSKTSPPRSSAVGVGKNRVAVLLRRTKGILDLHSAFKPSPTSKVKRTSKIFDLRGAFTSLTNKNTKRTSAIRNSKSSKERSSESSSPHYVGLCDPMPDKLQLNMSVDLDFLFCANHIIPGSSADHPLRSFYRTHPAQGIDQIGRLLRINGLTINVVHGSDTVDPDSWNVLHNRNAEQFTTIADYINCITFTGRATRQNWANWNATGAQLISRSLPAPDCDSFGQSVIQNRRADKSLLEIHDYLKVLTDTNAASFVVTRPDTSHVGISIGIGRGEEPLDEHRDLLKHLALLIVEYEDIISLFHHPDRRGWTDARANTRSHRYGATDNPHVCGTLSVDNILEIEAQIFGCRDVYALANLMESQSGRDTYVKVINWSNVVDYGKITGKTDTLVFWQHAGSRDILEIGHWIRLVVNMFRLAERRSHGINPPQKPQGLNINMSRIGEVNRVWVFEAQERRADDLLELLGLSRNDRKYWQERMHEYAKDDYLHRYQTSGFEKCPACEEVSVSLEQQALPQTPRVQRQIQRDIEQLLTPSHTDLDVPDSPLDQAEIDRIVADHATLGEQISAFINNLGLTPTKYTKEGGFVWQTFELARDCVQLEAEIDTLESRLETLCPAADADLRREIEGILRDDRRLHNEIEVLLTDQPAAESLGEHRLLRDLHELKISHANLYATIDTLRAQAALIPQPVRDSLAGSVVPSPVVGPHAGPNLRKMLNDLIAKTQQVKENHRSISHSLEEDHATLRRLEEGERRREKGRSERNARNLKDLAGEALDSDGERPLTVFESGGPDRLGYPAPIYDNDSSSSEEGGYPFALERYV
jgi:hypothetical protein